MSGTYDTIEEILARRSAGPSVSAIDAEIRDAEAKLRSLRAERRAAGGATWTPLVISRAPPGPLPEPPEGCEQPPIPCERCGTPQAWQWIPRLGQYTLPPDLCRTCRGLHEDEQKAARRVKVLQGAGIEELYRGYSFDRILWPEPFESLAEMRDRLAVTESVEGNRWLGCMPEDEQAIGAAAAWEPCHGSAWLEGPPGCGKTLIAMALAERLFAGTSEITYVRDTNGRVLGARVSGTSVVCTSEADLSLKITAHRSGFHRDSEGDSGAHPVQSAIRCGLLVIDDLGKDPKVAAAMEYIIDARYRARKPIIATLNRGIEGVRDVLGARVESRLADMTAGRRWSLKTVWRLR